MQRFCTGPVWPWVGTFTGGPICLGETESGPDVRFVRRYRGVQQDSGGEEDSDTTFQGAHAIISLDLIAWTEAVLNTLRLIDTVGVVPGTEEFGDVGKLMLQENAVFALWLQFPYAAKAAMSTMPAGYRFPFCYLDEESLPQIGTKAYKNRLVIHALRGRCYPDGTGPACVLAASVAPGKSLLWDRNMTGITLTGVG